MRPIRSIRLTWLAAALVAAACTDAIAPGTPVTSVEIVTTRRLFVENDTITFAARALASGGAPVEGPAASWTSSDPAIVQITPAGHARAVAAGTATLTATIADRAAAVNVEVRFAPVGEVVVSPAALALVQYEGRELAVTARDTAGRLLGGRLPVWRSLDTAVVTVDAMGRVVARGVGTSAVEADVGGVVRTVPVTVAATEVASVTAGPAPLVRDIGEYAQLIAVVRDTAGRSLIAYPRVWTTDAPRVATVTQFGGVGAVGPGYATITVSAGGKSFSVAITVSNGEADAMPADLVYHRTTGAATGEIVVASTAGTAAPIAIPLGIAAREVTPSPDGSRIAFRAVESGDIYVANRDGSDPTRLTDDAAEEGQPAWSPDGQRIAYRHLAADGRSLIAVMNADGTGKVALTDDLADTLATANPAWSPDGTRIAFDVTDLRTTPTAGGIWSMKSDGTNRIRHTTGHVGHGAPSWSPDGQRIAFTATAGDGADVMVLTIASGAMAQLNLPGAQSTASWSPDGRHIAFSQPLGDGTAIYTVRADGTNMRLHTLDAAWGNGYRPRWIDR